MPPPLTNLQQLLDRVDQAAKDQKTNGDQDRDRVSLEEIVTGIGTRSFGPLLLLPGVILFSPLSGIPGMPSIMAVFVLAVAGQLLFRRKHFWLPRWLLRRSISEKRLKKAVRWMERPARSIDRWIRPRLTNLVQGPGVYVMAILCVAIAAGLPVMEVVPFSASAAGLALMAFGLALTSRDGVLAIVAFVLTAGVFGSVVYSLL